MYAFIIPPDAVASAVLSGVCRAREHAGDMCVEDNAPYSAGRCEERIDEPRR
jgi:hypothetical protein